jgi:hypothetical protein
LFQNESTQGWGPRNDQIVSALLNIEPGRRALARRASIENGLDFRCGESPTVNREFIDHTHKLAEIRVGRTTTGTWGAKEHRLGTTSEVSRCQERSLKHSVDVHPRFGAIESGREMGELVKGNGIVASDLTQ